jgi:hypothetical protein
VGLVGGDGEDGAVGGRPLGPAESNPAVALAEDAEGKALVGVARKGVSVPVEPEELELPDREVDPGDRDPRRSFLQSPALPIR